jgi:hypothetical protein
LDFLRLDSDPVVDGAAQLLLAPQVTLGGLDRDVTEKKVDLIRIRHPLNGRASHKYGGYAAWKNMPSRLAHTLWFADFLFDDSA